MFYLEIRYVDRPDVISKFFRDCNCVDKHNQGRQAELALEKNWVTHNCFFRLSCTIIGVNVTDTLNLMHYHRLLPLSVRKRYEHYDSDTKKIPVKAFAGYLSAQLLQMADKVAREEEMKIKEWIHAPDDSCDDSTSTDNNKQRHDETMETLIYDDGTHRPIEGCEIITIEKDGNGKKHSLARFPVVTTGRSKKKRRRTQPCHECSKATTWFCVQCNKPYCKRVMTKTKDHGRNCFHDHIPNRMSFRMTDV